jgi:hypothetical protein
MSDKSMREYSRTELLELTPAKYLADGFVDAAGKPRAELQTSFATAASTQLLDAELSPQELAFTYEALRQSLAVQEGPAPKRIQAALEEGLETVRGMIRQPNNPGLVKWLNECVAAVKAPADIDALLAHMLAVLRQYTAIVAARRVD